MKTSFAGTRRLSLRSPVFPLFPLPCRAVPLIPACLQETGHHRGWCLWKDQSAERLHARLLPDSKSSSVPLHSRDIMSLNSHSIALCKSTRPYALSSNCVEHRATDGLPPSSLRTTLPLSYLTSLACDQDTDRLRELRDGLPSGRQVGAARTMGHSRARRLRAVTAASILQGARHINRVLGRHAGLIG